MSPNPSAPQVLIADDQPAVLDALRLLLKEEGWRAVPALRPVEILKAVESHTLDAVVMDLNYARDTTSGKEGLDVLGRVRALDATLPVIVMFSTTFLLLQMAAAQGAAPPGQSYDGASRPAVHIPRIASPAVTIDGSLSEPVWTQAARLTGFHQYQPIDGRPANEQTEARLFYSHDAIYFGIIANAKNPASIRATVADRDNLSNEDRITIYLDTFNDHRRAYFFVVNPLGAQGDGVRTEGAASAGNIFGGNVDWNPDFRFESKGQLTDRGYVVELRIPFKSLRFPSSDPQTWSINVVRDVQATGFEDTWTDARRATASFLSEGGSLTGIEHIERGITTEVQPFVTAQLNGERTPTGTFEREDINPDAGVNLKVALPSVTLDATVKPDFSQVESDASLVTVNERFALFFAEKRPFFLEGIELFNTPNQLVYTRQIATPVAGAKVTGKLGPVSVAYLSALDDTPCPNTTIDGVSTKQNCDQALFNVARLRRDFGGNSTIALTMTDRRAGDTTNTVIASDLRYVFGRMRVSRRRRARHGVRPARCAMASRSSASITRSAFCCSATLPAGALCVVRRRAEGSDTRNARSRLALSISSRLGRCADAVRPRFASARPMAEVSVFSRQATVLTSPSPIRSDASHVADGRSSSTDRKTYACTVISCSVRAMSRVVMRPIGKRA